MAFSRFIRFFKEPPRWEDYKSFYQITIFRYLTVWFSLVPIAAGILRGLPNPLPINLNGVVYNVDISLPFNWQLLWVSSLFFLISFVIYLVCCPKFIKKYNNFSDYLSYGHDKRWISWLARDLVSANVGVGKFIERLSSKKYLKQECNKFSPPEENIEVGAEQTIAYLKFENKVYSLGMPVLGDEPSAKDAERAIFWEIFGRYSSSGSLARNLIRVLLFLSLLFFIFVFYQHIESGFSYVYYWVLAIFNA